MRVVLYHSGLRDVWDTFAAAATTGTFLFQRGYLDYHADRFTDSSLLFYDERDRLIALLPANRAGDVLHSHQGLTYGGFLTHTPYTAQLIACFNQLVEWCQEAQIRQVTYKPVPFIYAAHPDQADLYCLFRLGATLSARQLATTLEHPAARSFTRARWIGIRKARRRDLHVRETTDFAGFWRVLEDNLRQRYATTPLHSLAEITTLHARFPTAIRLFAAYDAAGTMLAGGVVYVTARVAHTQYLATTPAGRTSGALDLLIQHLIAETRAEHRYFDLGTSNGEPGQQLNHHLVYQKEGFGGRGVCYDTYTFVPTTGARVEYAPLPRPR